MKDKPIVLYVDDEAANRLVFEATFDDSYNVHLADGGDSALRFLEANEVAVIVSDQRMANMKGNELLAIVRERWPHTIRIIVTAYKDVDSILQAVNQGLVARYVIKPWDAAELSEILDWGLQAHALAFESYGDILQARILEFEKLAALGALQASFLHELGTPLSYIFGTVSELAVLKKHTPQLLKLIASDTTRPPSAWDELLSLLTDFPEILDNLETGANLLTHLRQDVQVLVKKGADEEDRVCSAREVQRAIAFAISVTKSDAILTHTVLRYDAPNVVPHLQISPEDLMLVLINLTRNAIQAQPPDRAGNEVVFSLESDDSLGVARISVSDNGMGMSNQVSKAVGRQFYTTREMGTGLGVFRCRALLGSVGGTLDYSSTPGIGTTATAIIPLSLVG